MSIVTSSLALCYAPMPLKRSATRRKEKKGRRKRRVKPKPTPQELWNEVVESSSDSDEGENVSGGGNLNKSIDHDDGRGTETAEEVRVRLAKAYLQKLGNEENEKAEEISSPAESGSEDDEEGSYRAGVDREEEESNDEDRIGVRLERERKSREGTLRRKLAHQLESKSAHSLLTRGVNEEDVWTGHKLPVTCVALSSDDRLAASGGKDNAVFLWDVEKKQKRVLIPKWKSGSDVSTFSREVLAVALSSDGRFLASGGRDRTVHVWDLRTKGESTKLTGHMDAVSSLSFRRDSYDLYSGSLDRCIKHWNIAQMGYVETLFGHQSFVTALDAYRRERVVSCGQDRTVRLWKIPEETHLVFQSGNSTLGSAECISCLDDSHFVTGSDAGTVALWVNSKKKPVALQHGAHGGAGKGVENWVSCISSYPSSDLSVSGSCDGWVRFWRTDVDTQIVEEVAASPLLGYVNGMRIATSGKFLIAATGKEHRLGRWSSLPQGRNSVSILRLPLDLAER